MFITLLLIILCVVLAGAVLYLVTRKQKTDPILLEWLKVSQQQMASSNTQVSQSITTQTREINERLTRAAEVIGELKEMGKSMKDLDSLLKSPKLRGNMGERVLADLIGQVFPKQHFFLQHRFKS